MISIRSWIQNILEPSQHTVQAHDFKHMIKKKKKKDYTRTDKCFPQDVVLLFYQRCRDIVHFETHAPHDFVLPPTIVEKKASAH